MRPRSQVSKELKAQARQAQETVFSESAGEGGRRENWSYFVKDTLADYSLRELALACVEEMTANERRMFLVTVDLIKPKRG